MLGFFSLEICSLSGVFADVDLPIKFGLYWLQEIFKTINKPRKFLALPFIDIYFYKYTRLLYDIRITLHSKLFWYCF